MNGLKMQSSGLVLLSLLVASVYTGKILVFPVDGSHWINMKILIEALHTKGHNITVIRSSDSWYIEETSPLYTSITLPIAGNFDKEFIQNVISRLLEIMREGSTWARLKLEKEMWDQSVEMFEKERRMMISMIEDQELIQSLRNAKYDVFLTDPVVMSGTILSHYLHLPLVFNVRWTINNEGHFTIAPSPLSYVPLPMLELSDHMSFFERVVNVVIVDFVFEFPRPTMPNVIYMGGFHCKPSKPLPQHLEDFVQSSGDHGVIVMSLGTLVGQLPHDVANLIAEAFAELPQKVIWRYKGERPSTVGNNTLIMDWMPQNDLLGHPKTRVFVAHGGTNGIQEAIYHGVPIIGFGLVWDQPDNLAKMRVKGVAKNVNFATVDKDSFLLTLKEVLHDPSYRENMQRLSRLHRDVPIKPLDNAVFWIEYLMRHGGAAMNGLKMQSSGLVLLSLLVASVYTGKILVFPVDGSHWINMKILIEALHTKGHNITVIRSSDSWYIEETSPLYTSITLGKSALFEQDFIWNTVGRYLEIMREGSTWARLKLEKEMWDTVGELVEREKKMLISMTGDQELIQSLRDAKYDVFLTDPAFMSGVVVGHYLHLPIIFNVRWTVHHEGHFAIAPSPLSYVPLPMLELSDHMSFFERVVNVVIVDFVFEFPRPTMPNVIYMGGFHCKPSKPLPQHLEDFVQSSGDHGVIVMSLGTMVGQLPHDVANLIAEAFAELPQKVIWRYKGERPSTVGNNTLIMDWMPQNDLLGHPKTRVFVAHGGTNGIQEAIYHGVPIIGFGLVWDQPDNLAKMRVKGVAKNVNFATVDKDSFLLTLKEVLHDPSYRENMQRLSRLHRDVPIKPLDNAVFWIEYLMRHGGAAHLRTESYKMPWYSYHSAVEFTWFIMFIAAAAAACENGWLTLNIPVALGSV
ncbi:hypothetical protein KOW79_020382 [Hemibagrus wyckioides]|uniref:Uncharacterized protein n=1 Tax=Hemibagrus wyckioides TaxID=337641 RepID=A0A9D3S8S7_9TELE|nr:hypothetical protein KOW79_020382 [Hemibagrus wyckioides]